MIASWQEHIIGFRLFVTLQIYANKPFKPNTCEPLQATVLGFTKHVYEIYEISINQPIKSIN